MYPLKFKPIFKTIVWGGEKIAPYKGVETAQEHIGESWELSGVKGNESVVAHGALAGKTIAELVKEYKGRLVGEHVYADTGDEFPLLIKFIDALSDLSVQVHPNDGLAAVRHNGSKGKTEMWYVVGAEPGAHLLAGMTEEITPDEYERRVADGTITDVLARHDVHPGDVFFLPAGRIHAICGGCFIAEIQQTSDITYRIYDYGRLGLDGKPRELHTELAKDAIDYKVYPDYRTPYTPVKNAENEVVSCKYFTTSIYDLDQVVTKDLSDTDSFLVVMCLSGHGTLTDAEPVFDAEGRRGPTKGHAIDLRQGETVLVPASSQNITFTPSEEGMKVLTSYIR
jgi:mannose-6-phosphate isomerase